MEIPQLILAQHSETVVQPHQFRDAVLTEGPTSLPRFRAHKWCFQVRGVNSVNELSITLILMNLEIEL